MKSISLAAIFAALLSGCADAPRGPDNLAGQEPAAYPQPSYLAQGLRSDHARTKGPRLVVGTRYPDEPLYLPWFLDDAISAVNAR